MGSIAAFWSPRNPPSTPATLPRAQNSRVCFPPASAWHSRRKCLAEFIHVVTDPRRFTQPLEIGEARRLAGQWWTARDVDQVFPDEAAVRQFFAWLEQHRLGRKRLLDTFLAATYRVANIASILTTDPHDFTVLGGFTCIVPSAPTPSP